MAALLTPTGPTAAELAAPAAARAWKAAQDFEGVLLGELMAPMFDTVDQSQGPFGGGAGERAWRSQWTQALGRTLADHGGLGLAMPVYRQILRMQEAADPQANPLGASP